MTTLSGLLNLPAQLFYDISPVATNTDVAHGGTESSNPACSRSESANLGSLLAAALLSEDMISLNFLRLTKRIYLGSVKLDVD